MDCLFCDIASKKIPAHLVYEDDFAVGFLDIGPKAPGHTVVIPKIHSESILEMKTEAIGPFFGAVRAVTAKLKKALAPDGFTIGVNHGKSAGQAIDHLHVHILPRWANDGGGSIHSIVSNLPKESLESIKEKILEAG